MGDLSSDFEVINYLENTPSKGQLEALIALLKIPAEQLMRKNEPIFVQHFSGKQLSEDECINAMIAYPILIERPIVVHGNKAVIGRPMQHVIDLFQEK